VKIRSIVFTHRKDYFAADTRHSLYQTSGLVCQEKFLKMISSVSSFFESALNISTILNENYKKGDKQKSSMRRILAYPYSCSSSGNLTLSRYIRKNSFDQNVCYALYYTHQNQKESIEMKNNDDLYRETIMKTANMVADRQVQKLVKKYGLQILNLTWEDTGRYKDSCVGPNISDMTIQVSFERTDGTFEVKCMPVIRFPNFSDSTADIDPGDFVMLVGNEKGKPLKRISLYDFLEAPTKYLHNPDSWKAKQKSLLCDRDSKVLVSAQACFLPVPKKGKATFNPVLFNYQSCKEDPAVLTVLATREGTSVTVIDNVRDAFSEGSAWGQRLFFNDNGQRASPTGERESEFLERTEPHEHEKVSPELTSERETAASGLNMVLLVQIPLKQKKPMRFEEDYLGSGVKGILFAEACLAESDVEDAVIGHGEWEGPFTEIDDLEIERDEQFPVRVTVQFYKATSNGIVSEKDMQEIKEQIDKVYAQSDYVGSLVTEGETGRITEYEGSKVEPPDWWDKFWERHEQNTGDSREVAIQKLINLLGVDYREQPVCDLYLRQLLRKHNL